MYARDSVHAQPTDSIDRFPGAQPSLDKEYEAAAMNTRLVTYAIPELHRQVTICHLVYGWSFSDIAHALGIPSKQTAYNLFKSAVIMLRERDYGR